MRISVFMFVSTLLCALLLLQRAHLLVTRRSSVEGLNVSLRKYFPNVHPYSVGPPSKEERKEAGEGREELRGVNSPCMCGLNCPLLLIWQNRRLES